MPEDVNPKRPASQYYWGDWWKDKGLQSCSQPARGLWHEMNTLMHEGEPYGHLTVNGKPMTIGQLANLCRIPPARCKAMVDELLAAGVPSVDSTTGALFSRRMVRDERIRNARAAGGEGGAQHGIKGASHGGKGGRPVKDKGGFETPLNGFEETPLGGSGKPPPSSSSSSSSSSSPSGGESPSGPPASAKQSSKARASKRVPEDFCVTAEMEQWAREVTPLVDVERETENFRDWEFKQARSDWPATWRSWMRKAQGDAAQRAPKVNGRDTVEDWTRNAI